MSFTSEIEAFAKKANGNVEQVVRRTIIELGKRLVYKSPVGDASYWKHKPPAGYVGGRFRANWQYGFQRPSGNLLFTTDASGSSTISKIEQEASGMAGLHYITNNVPYAKAIEEGHSKRQAPQGVVMLTVLEFENVIGVAATGIKV